MSRRQYLALSFISLLAFRYFTPTNASNPTHTSTPLDTELCQTHDAPNPIAHLYPSNATGTLNGTITILPIPLPLARRLIPAQYPILTHAYRSLLPSFPLDTYPLLLQALHDHDVQAFGHKIPDFTRTGLEFPFLDLLHDGHTSFKWAPSLLMTAGHEIALKGALDYGTATFPALFDPPCDAYRSVGDADGTTAFEARGVDAGAAVAAVSTLLEKSGVWTYPLRFFQNVTNQPSFADGKTCDNMIRLFNTSVTRGIETVRGRVKVNLPPFTGEREWSDAEGIRFDSAFIENNYLPCENFRGYGEA